MTVRGVRITFVGSAVAGDGNPFSFCTNSTICSFPEIWLRDGKALVISAQREGNSVRISRINCTEGSSARALLISAATSSKLLHCGPNRTETGLWRLSVEGCIGRKRNSRKGNSRIEKWPNLTEVKGEMSSIKERSDQTLSSSLTIIIIIIEKKEKKKKEKKRYL